MVEPLFFCHLPNVPEPGSQVVLGGSEGKHAASVRRMRIGEAIQLTDGHGLRVRGVVAELAEKQLTVSVVSAEQEDPAQLKLTLIQALAKGDRDELAVQAATELGARDVYPWQAERSISRWDPGKAIKGQARWQIICDEAAKQSLRSFFPQVHPVITSAELAAKVATFDQVLVLDPTSKLGLAEAAETTGRVALIVGPEGGIDDAELNHLEAAGALRVHLGEHILRTSTAGVAAIAIIQAKTGYYS